MFRRLPWYVFILFLVVALVTPVSALTVVIDPGHGGSDPGAIGVNGLHESDVNLDVSIKLYNELLARGYHPILTRETDVNMSLEERVDFKEHHDADLFVSIHANSFNRSDVKGSLVLYYDNRYPQRNYPASPEMVAMTSINKQFAQTVVDELVKELNTDNRGLLPHSAYVVRNGTMPSILVETAFLSNWEDIQKLSSDSERTKMAIGIANGIERFSPLGGFFDIAGHWAFDSIVKLKDKGIVQGSNARYNPQQPLTRAEFLTMMDRVFQFTEVTENEEDILEDEIPDEEITEEDTNVDEETIVDEKIADEDHASETEVEEDSNASQKGTVEISSLVTGSILPQFKDLEHNHWAYEVIEQAYDKGYIQGYPDGTARPNQPITRAEVTVLFDRIWGDDIKPDTHDIFIDILFVDVPDDAWYATAVYRLKQASIIQGMTEDTFIPERFMNRAEIAVMLDRYMERTDIHQTNL